jgi:hypothetical protein
VALKRFSPNPLILGRFAAKSTRGSDRPPDRSKGLRIAREVPADEVKRNARLREACLGR